MKKILITGAGGFIGSHVVNHLLADGEKPERLRLLISENSKIDKLFTTPLEIVRGDIRNKAFVKKAVEGVEIIYHVAALSGLKGTTYRDYKEVNVDGTQNLLDASSKNKLQKFVFFSTIAVYGLPAWTGDIINWDETHKKTYSEVYGQSKYEAEKRVLKLYDRVKMPYTIIRPTSVYGPRDKGQLYELYKAIKNHTFVMIGNGKNKMDYVFVKDLVKGARLAQLSSSQASEYILGGDQPIEFSSIVRFVAKSIDTKIFPLSIPTSLGLALANITQGVAKIMGIQAPLFPTRVRVMTTNYYYSIRKAKKELNYRPVVSFEKGIMITGNWYLKHQYL